MPTRAWRKTSTNGSSLCLTPGRFCQAEPRSTETFGTSICAAADFERIGGYDEVIQGWGKEDEDFYARLFLAGIRYASFPSETASGAQPPERQRLRTTR